MGQGRRGYTRISGQKHRCRVYRDICAHLGGLWLRREQTNGVMRWL